jgi:hypothetical protein
MSQHTDAPEIYHRACAYTVMGSLLMRDTHRCVLAEGVPSAWTNLYVVLVGDSGKDRKSTCIAMAQELLDRIEPDLKCADDMSPEGLLKYLAQRGGSESGATTLMFQTEFVGLLQQFQRSYSQLLRAYMLSLYDSPPIFKRTLKSACSVITRPRLALLGGITREFLASFGRSDDWAGGFFNRCLFVQGTKTREQLNMPVVLDSTYDELAHGLSKCLETWRLALEAREFAKFHAAVETETIGDAIAKASDNPEAQGMLSRSRTHWQKIAALEQIDEDPTAKTVGKAAAERAAVFIRQWQASMPGIVRTCSSKSRADFDGDKLGHSILRFLEESGTRVAYCAIVRRCCWDTQRVQNALQSLLAGGLVRSVNVAEADGSESHYYEAMHG